MRLVPFRAAFASILGSRSVDSAKRAKRVQARLGMESLEVRQVMAVSVWSGAVDNYWSTAGNWDTPPSAGDSLVFPATAVNLNSINDFSLGQTFGTLTINGSGFNISGNGINLNGSVESLQAAGSESVNLNVSFIGANPTIEVGNPGAEMDWSGTLSSGCGPLVKSGAGQLTLLNSVTLNQPLVVSSGRLVNQASLNSGLSLQPGATLQGQGRSVSLSSTGGTITPGSGGVGLIQTIGDLTLDTNSSFLPTLTNPTPGTGFGQIQAGGQIALGNALLLPALGSGANLTSPFVVIDNTGTSPISGTFKALAEGTSFPVGDEIFSITYKGGDGNDVVLTRQLDSTTTLTTSVNPSGYGQMVDLTATVASVGGGSTPTGTVTFYDGVVLLGTSTLDATGKATLSTSAFNIGHNSLTAIYSGSLSNNTSTSVSVDQIVNQTLTGTTLVSSVNPSIFGQSVRLTATVSAVAPGGGTPSGSVTFYNGGSAIGVALLDSNGSASLITNSLPVGTDSLTAFYSGSVGYISSTSAPLSQVVDLVPTTTTLTGTPSPSVYGQLVNLSAHVSANSPSVLVPQGVVSFYNGADLIGTGVVDASGDANLSTSLFSVGNLTLSASFVDGMTFQNSTSAPISQLVQQSGTVANLTTSPNPSIYGQNVQLTVLVSAQSPGAGTPSGSVTFYSDSTPIGSGLLDANGSASLTTSSLAVGTASLTAVYSGSLQFLATTSAPVYQAVDAVPTSITLTSTPSPSVYGQSVLLSAQVTSNSPSVLVPSGVVNFYYGAELIGFSAVDSSGNASISTATFSAGNATVTARFAGSTNFQNSTSGVVTQVVQQSGTVTTLTASPNPSNYGQYVQLTVLVSAVSPGAGTPSGTVTIYNGNTSLGSSPVDANGSAILNTSQLPIGNNSLSVVYDGTNNYLGSTSNTVVQSVVKATTSTSLSTSPNPSGYGQSVTLVANVTANLSLLSPPTGNITFYNGNLSIGSSAVDANGSATFSTTALPSGNLSITASYPGDANYASSTSPVVTQQVYQTTANLTLTASTLNPSSTGQVTFTANVAATSAGSPEPTGNVTFYSNGAKIGTGTLSSGQANLTITGFDLGLGVNSITATYNGDSVFTPVTSAPLEVKAGTDNERFINQSYLVIIGRQPNSQTVEAWNTYLQNGHSRAWVVGMMRRSAAGRAALIQNIFTTYLGRTASNEELAGVVAAAKATGTSPRAIVLGSREFFDGKGGGSIPTYLKSLESTLGTTFSAYAFERMTSQLASGMLPAKVAEEALLSPAGLKSLGQSLYQQTYGRAATSDEVAAFIRRSNRGIYWRSQQVYLMGSNEFYAYAISQKGNVPS